MPLAAVNNIIPAKRKIPNLGKTLFNVFMHFNEKMEQRAW
jgi:hypothetical protein